MLLSMVLQSSPGVSYEFFWSIYPDTSETVAMLTHNPGHQGGKAKVSLLLTVIKIKPSTDNTLPERPIKTISYAVQLKQDLHSLTLQKTFIITFIKLLIILYRKNFLTICLHSLAILDLMITATSYFKETTNFTRTIKD